MDLVELVYQETAKFPKEERYGLISQMRRSAVSIPCNIAEGSGRKGDKELIQFIAIALGSIAELETQYMIAVRLKFIEENNRLRDLIIKVRQLLIGYRNYLKEKT
ncbi:four helix bundle protein [Vitellibacter sp. q18]|nr:four helix bundle protein [Aequorivita lutea]